MSDTPATPETPVNTQRSAGWMRRLVLVLRILFEIVFMLIFTPLIILLGGVFQTWDEWKESIQGWKREWNDQNRVSSEE